jgi:hypothetical protein
MPVEIKSKVVEGKYVEIYYDWLKYFTAYAREVKEIHEEETKRVSLTYVLP